MPKLLYVPDDMVLVVEIVTVELHVGLHEVGLNEQDAPDGKL